MNKAVIRLFLLSVFVSCNSNKEKATVNPSEQGTTSEKVKNYVYISRDKKDTVFTNRPIALITPTPVVENEKGDWEKNYFDIKTINKYFPSNDFKIDLFSKKKLSFDSGFYGCEDTTKLEKPVETIDTGRIISVIEPIQNKLLAPTFKDNAQYNIWCLGPDQGLASRNVYSIEKDDKGFMWFGTDKGLIRYDGTNTKTYNTESGLPDNKIRVVKKDKKGNLWLGTESSGLVKFDGKTFHHYSLDSIAPKRPISDIEFDEKGDLWCTVFFCGLLHFDGKTFYSYKQKQGMISSRPTTSISFDKNGRMWITGYGRGLSTLTEKGILWLTTEANFPEGRISYMHSSFVDKDNRLFIGVYGPDYCIIDKDTARRYLVPDNKGEGFTSIVQDKQGSIWASQDVGGIYKLGEKSITHISQQHGISSDIIYTMFVDDNNKIWIGTEGGGVCCFDPESTRALNVSRGSVINYYNRVVELKEGGYLIGADNGLHYYKDSALIHLAECEKKGKRIYSLIKSCTDIAIDKKGMIYAPFLNFGVMFFDKKEDRFKGIYRHGVHRNMANIEVLDNNERWFSGMGPHGFYRITETQRLNYVVPQNFFLNNITSMLVGRNGIVWQGSAAQGVCAIKDDVATYFNTSNGLPDNAVNSMYEDKDGRIWAATSNGLSYFDTNKFVKVEFYDEINENIKGVIQDNQNRYWITTDNGIIVLTPKTINQKDWNVNNYYVNTLGKQDGLLNASFTNGSIMINSKNELVVGSEGNLLFYPIDNFKISTEKPKAILETIEINGQAINFRDRESLDSVNLSLSYDSVTSYLNLPINLTLPSNLNHLTFQYSGLYWSGTSKIKYVYYLEGLETEWSRGANQNTAEYRNLSYGKYKFHLKAVTLNGNESEELVYSFEIERPWWHTWWARALYLLAILSAIGLFIKYRTRQLQKRQLELETEVKIATEEIRTQKEKIEEAHTNIKDSIMYAKRIQSGILPSERFVKEYLKESFIFYKPKDIVAGDFYWMERKDDFILFAAADCTGHGVPGAMVSVVCNNGLNRSVREFGLTDPGKILDKTREIIIAEFEKSDEDVKDGMDISLCALNLKTRKLFWAGANNPIWVIRKDSNELMEIKGNKQPIGKYIQSVPFQTHQIDLKGGDTFYVFTDGYQDQFGGENGKKFKASQLKELLLRITNEPMDVQKRILGDTIEKWIGVLEQIDDMCVVGVRV